jgi:hypothetical protein
MTAKRIGKDSAAVLIRARDVSLEPA